jgi:hypothetical protein
MTWYGLTEESVIAHFAHGESGISPTLFAKRSIAPTFAQDDSRLTPEREESRSRETRLT